MCPQLLVKHSFNSSTDIMRGQMDRETDGQMDRQTEQTNELSLQLLDVNTPKGTVFQKCAV